jgi:alpha-beta hydrolase superfamily lysophospholipase
MLIRLSKIANANKVVDLRLYLAAWWSFKPAWRFLNKNLGNNKYNMFYIQSGQDFMIEKKYFNKFQTKWNTTNRIKYIENGYHVLAAEEPWNEELYKFISDNI